jgi:hypothetical protein
VEERAQTRGYLKADERLRRTSPVARSILDFAVPEGYMLVPIQDAAKIGSSTCTCGCHESPRSQRVKSTYCDASIQTDNMPSPPRTALRVDTTSASTWSSSNELTAVSQADMSPIYDDYPVENPIFLGRTTSYFSKPGYQLGDSLMSHHQMYEQEVYQYQDKFGEEVLG